MPFNLPVRLDRSNSFLKYIFCFRLFPKAGKTSSERFQGIHPRYQCQAVRHPLPEKRAGRGYLIISAECRKDILYLAVEDNGPGFGGDKADEVMQSESRGYGQKNVNERIRIFYGEQYGLHISGEQDENTKIEIMVPFCAE